MVVRRFEGERTGTVMTKKVGGKSDPSKLSLNGRGKANES